MTSLEIAEVLNDAFNTDPQAIAALVELRVPCNKALADHQAVQVQVKNDGKEENRFPVVGFLGLLQAVAALDGHRIWADYDDETHCLLRFTARPISGEQEKTDSAT